MAGNSFASPDRPTEIIEHMQAESGERYRTLFELAPVAVYSCDVSGVIRDYNNRAVELWGRKPQLGDTDECFCGSFKLYRPDGSFMPHEQCPMGDVLAGKVSGTHDAEVHIERPDGSRIIVIVNIAPLKDDRGEITARLTASTMSPSARRLRKHCAKA
jgi:PAS domain-containing protein